MSDERDEQVRKRAYGIWEREGRPEGRHDDHWHQAEREMTAEETPPGNEGEGSRTAARAYDQGVQETVKAGHVDEAARDAAKALDGPDKAELGRAEAEGKRRSQGEDPALKKKK